MRAVLRAVAANVRREPALLTTFAGAVLLLLVEAGVPVSEGLQRAIQGVILAAVALAIRSQVTPAGEVAAQQLPSGVVVSGPADGIRPDGTPVEVVVPEAAHEEYEGEHREDPAGA